MERISVAEASRDFRAVVDRVKQGIAIELEDNELIVATISPAPPTPPRVCRTMNDLAALLNSLPDLGDDAEAFARDIEEARNSYLPETDPWES